jgi:DNA-binding NarL/FixJ family response regulator
LIIIKVAGEYILNDKKNNISLSARKNRIAVVDDHPVILEGLAQLINREDDLLVCVKADSEKEAFKAIRKQQVDLVIVDMLLKNTTGVQVAEKLRSQYPSLHILILSMSDDRHHVKGAFKAGARGYITKDEVSEKIIAGIRQVLKGGIYVSKKLARKFSRQTIVSWILEVDSGDTLGKV